MPLWRERAHRAYLNAVECFAPLAAVAIVAQIARKGERDDGSLCDELLLAEARARHRLLGGYPYVGTLAFTLGFICVAGIFWEVIK